MYGTQTDEFIDNSQSPFENDVKMYGTQTSNERSGYYGCLRMM